MTQQGHGEKQKGKVGLREDQDLRGSHRDEEGPRPGSSLLAGDSHRPSSHFLLRKPQWTACAGGASGFPFFHALTVSLPRLLPLSLSSRGSYKRKSVALPQFSSAPKFFDPPRPTSKFLSSFLSVCAASPQGAACPSQAQPPGLRPPSHPLPHAFPPNVCAQQPAVLYPSHVRMTPVSRVRPPSLLSPMHVTHVCLQVTTPKGRLVTFALNLLFLFFMLISVDGSQCSRPLGFKFQSSLNPLHLPVHLLTVTVIS